MKVASMALDDYTNYGNNLQKYALQRTLKKFVDDAELLWHTPMNFFPETLRLTYTLNPIPRNCNSTSYQKYLLREAIRLNKMKEFENRHIKVRFDLPYLEEISDDYDFFVVGSDQVWNPTAITPKYFLNFAPRKKRIAYAASVAAPSIPAQLKNFFKQGISGFDHISVREENSVKLIKELTGQDAILLLDPTMTLTPQEWLEIAQKPSWFNEKYQRGYILTYYLRSTPPEFIKDFSNHLKLPLINLLDWNNYWYDVVGPEEFLYLFANASAIFTNSFHGVVFSILFRRPFMNAEIDQNFSMSTRIPGLLKTFGLESRIMSTKRAYSSDEFLEIDYSTRDRILPLERGRAFKFLSNALGIMPHPKTGGGSKL